MAVLFLVALVGLSVSGPEVRLGNTILRFYGWPLPCAYTGHEEPDAQVGQLTLEQLADRQWIPWTHSAYHYVFFHKSDWATKGLILWGDDRNGGRIPIVCATLDAVFALIPLALILFLQIPRRKVAAKGE